MLRHYGKRKTSSDIRKGRDLAADAAVYAVLLAIHPLAIVPKRVKGIVGFSGGINRTLDKCHGSQGELRVVAEQRIRELLKETNVALVRQGRLRRGQAFGLGAEVLYWIVQGCVVEITLWKT
jgi:hypothetical protein